MLDGALDRPFLEDLEWRGLLKQRTAELVEPDFKSRPVLYVGYDPSAGSLHAGSLIPILTMDRFRRRGGQILVLLGGATGMIGDPSGKDQERVLEDEFVVEERIEQLRAQLRGIFTRTDGPEPIFVNNADWYRAMGVITFLRDIGKNFSVNQMLARESVRSRIEEREQGISFTEFSYQIFQAYDYLHLHRKYSCTIQMGASDQWGNIVSGVDLIRRTTGQVVHGLTLPLLTNAEGKKYGKSEKGAIWLDPALTSPYEFYQFWYNSTDTDAPMLLRLLSDFSAEEIARFQSGPPSARVPQKELAKWLTARVHGVEQARLASRASAVIFSGAYDELKPDLVEMLAQAVPTYTVPTGERSQAGANLVNLGAAQSKNEARRLIEQRSVAANGTLVLDFEEDLRRYSTNAGAVIVAVGKARRFLIRFSQTEG